MEINPYDSRLRMLQQIDTVAMQREAAPDEETAGCPGCPYFWTCPVPHRGEEVKAPAEIDLEDVLEVLGPRREYSPRDESDVGWTDVWVDENGLRLEPEERLDALAETSREAPSAVVPADALAEELDAAPSPRGWRRMLRRRR